MSHATNLVLSCCLVARLGEFVPLNAMPHLSGPKIGYLRFLLVSVVRVYILFAKAYTKFTIEYGHGAHTLSLSLPT